jgi:CO/xanthine dehydrogenase Mo-binding subunit
LSWRPRFPFSACRFPRFPQSARLLKLVIASDGSITVFSGRVGLGTGVSTALRQIVAEELDAPFDRITWVQGDSDRTVDQGSTVGSQSVKRGGAQLRRAAAEARSVLLELASAKLGAPTDSLVVAAGVISVRGDETRRATFSADRWTSIRA